MLKPVPEGKQLGWNLSILGKATISNSKGERVDGEIISIDNVHFGELSSRFGKVTMGYNGVYGQWAFEEEGGVVSIPYTVSPEGELYVGGGFEKRLLVNDGEEMFTPPGGFALKGESPEHTSKREILEETGIHINQQKLIGCATPNRAFWIKESEKRWPLSFYAFKIEWDSLIEKDGKLFIPSNEGMMAGLDKLSTLIFLPVVEAISKTNDGIAVTAYAKVLAAFAEKKID